MYWSSIALFFAILRTVIRKALTIPCVRTSFMFKISLIIEILFWPVLRSITCPLKEVNKTPDGLLSTRRFISVFYLIGRLPAAYISTSHSLTPVNGK
jgi:hypothetical protein